MCRPGINAAVAEAASSYFAHVTVLFFPDDKRRSRHMKLYERSGMPQLMPLVTRVQETTLHRCRAFAPHTMRSPEPPACRIAAALLAHRSCTAPCVPGSVPRLWGRRRCCDSPQRHPRCAQPKHRAAPLTTAAPPCSAHGCAARLPGHIYVHKGEGIDAAQAKCTSLLESHNEAATIWCQLARLLVMTHKRGIVLRDLQKRNVVRIQTRAGLQWTLLEFGNVTRPNALAMSVTARTCPPEVRRTPLAATVHCFHMRVSDTPPACA